MKSEFVLWGEGSGWHVLVLTGHCAWFWVMVRVGFCADPAHEPFSPLELMLVLLDGHRCSRSLGICAQQSLHPQGGRG